MGTSLPRRLSAILCADIVGYSRLVAADEDGTLARVRELRDHLIDPAIATHGGRVVKRTGDGALVEFVSVVDAVRAARLVQEQMTEREEGTPVSRRIDLRIGINLGDVVVEDDDIFGDAVNIAARLEQLCPPGGILVSGPAFDQFASRSEFPFRFVGEQRLKNIPSPVRAYVLDGTSAEKSSTVAVEAPMTQELPGKPSLVVLPFSNRSSDPEQAFLCDGISEDVIAGLSRFGGLFVISRNTSFSFRDRTLSSREVSRELGVQYVIDGSVRRAGSRIRVTANLVDAITDRPVWSERYDREAGDVFAVQDDLVQRIVASVAPEIGLNEMANAVRSSRLDLSAWEALSRGQWHALRFTEADSAQARQWFETALAQAPDDAEAHTRMSWLCIFDAIYSWHRPQRDSLDLAVRHARQAIDRNPRNSDAQVGIGAALYNLRQHDDAMKHFVIAKALNPNSSVAHGMAGVTLTYMHEFDRAKRNLDTALRLSPRDPFRSLYIAHYGMIAFNAGRYDEGVPHFRDAVRENPRQPSPQRGLVAALGMAGRLDEARSEFERLNAMMPGVTLAQTRLAVGFARDDDGERFLEGLRRAGMPE